MPGDSRQGRGTPKEATVNGDLLSQGKLKGSAQGPRAMLGGVKAGRGTLSRDLQRQGELRGAAAGIMTGDVGPDWSTAREATLSWDLLSQGDLRGTVLAAKTGDANPEWGTPGEATLSRDPPSPAPPNLALLSPDTEIQGP